MIGAPYSCNFLDNFSGVCPPKVTTTPSGCSKSKTFKTSSNVKGSKYNLVVVS